jgi:hypothetical protein
MQMRRRNKKKKLIRMRSLVKQALPRGWKKSSKQLILEIVSMAENCRNSVKCIDRLCVVSVVSVVSLLRVGR